MTKSALISPFGEISEPLDKCLLAAEERLRDAREAVSDYADKVRQGEIDHLKDAKKVVSDLHDAIGIFLKERSRVAEERRKRIGAAGDFAIDFDSARSEVLCRLARLRAAENG